VRARTADARRPKRERRTALAPLNELRSQGCAGGYRRLTNFVRVWREREGAASARTFLPLAVALGDAHFDWSEENLVVGGIHGKCVGISVERFGPDAARATAATNALGQGADIVKVQEWLGHANVSTTRIYDHHKTRPKDSPTFKLSY